MLLLLAFFLIIDVLIVFYLYKEAYVVRSNMAYKYKTRFKILLAVLAGAVAASWVSLPLATLIAGIPAGIMILYIGTMAIVLMTGKGRWQ